MTDLIADLVLAEAHGPVTVLRLNRPKALNALCDAMMAELERQLVRLDADPDTGAVVITGSDAAFAAGADIRELQDRTFPEIALRDPIASWDAVSRMRKPVIAAVGGFALGGGCELAMMCDLILAAPNAVFGQPETALGIIPGAGGTQRLVRAVGKARAMDMILTGRRMDAAEAERSGLVSRIVPADRLIEEALALGRRIAAQSPAAIALAKRAVNRAFETGLGDGLVHERVLFHSLFGTEHQREGMAAFLEKRTADFGRG